MLIVLTMDVSMYIIEIDEMEMMYMMNNKEFADKAVKIAKNYKTSYMLGAFGFQATNKNIKRLLNQCPENYNWLAQAENADWLFDCVNLCKAIIWGWNGSDEVYGGAKYCSNNMPDIDADSLGLQCSSVSSDFSKIEIGEVLLMPGHCGIYIGNGCAVEATASWGAKVMITAVGNIGNVPGLNTRYWKSHGKLKQVDYSVSNSTSTSQQQINYKQAIPARYFSKGYADQYRVTPNIGVNIRTQPSVKGAIIKAIPIGSIVNCYGYFGLDENGEAWLYIKYGNIIGYIKKEFLS